MAAPSSVIPVHSDAQHSNEKSLSPSTASTTISASIADNANNILIDDSEINITTGTVTFDTINDPSSVASLDVLNKAVAPNAILKTGGSADEVGCRPGTYEEELGLIEKSIYAQNHSSPRMIWVGGSAGAGKTTIMQTVAERCEKQGVPHANFFFSRADSSRNNAAPFVATLVQQIIQLYPSVGPAVAAALASNPLLLQMGLQEQFDTLMHLPFTAVQHRSLTPQPVALLIDGLDQCGPSHGGAQREILEALDTLLIQKGLHFRVVVASRAEPQIAMAFTRLCSQIDSIFLDNQISVEKDILLYICAEFEKIRSTHYLAHTLGGDWPAATDIDAIVTKSSGLFIYAATVMRFIAHSPASPILSLQRVQGVIHQSKNRSFANLDTLYMYILSQAEDKEALRNILASKLLVAEPTTIQTCLEACHPRYSAVLMNLCLANLSPLVTMRSGQLIFYHASFPDFLQNKDRAGEFYVDLEAFCTATFPKMWPVVPSLDWVRIDIRMFAILTLQRVRRPTPEITTVLVNTNLSEFEESDLRARAKDFMIDLHRLYAPHDPKSFAKIMRKWTSDNEVFREIINTETDFTAGMSPRWKQSMKAFMKPSTFFKGPKS